MISQLAVNFAMVIVLMLMLWGLACLISDVSFIDAVWAFGMVMLAWTAALMAWPPGGLSQVAWLLLGLTSLWGVRLGMHLLLRWQDLGPDPRYEKIIGRAMERRGWGFGLTALVMVFLLQGPLLWWVCLPAQVGILGAGPADQPTLIGWIGVVLAVAGILFETIGDAQLAAFRRDPASQGKVMDRGLWRYTRHPNYFGDACCWWGIYILAASNGGVAIWTLLSPLFLTFTLMRWSGAPLLEGRLKKTRPDYADYVARTSGFFPWPPRLG